MKQFIVDASPRRINGRKTVGIIERKVEKKPVEKKEKVEEKSLKDDLFD